MHAMCIQHQIVASDETNKRKEAHEQLKNKKNINISVKCDFKIPYDNSTETDVKVENNAKVFDGNSTNREDNQNCQANRLDEENAELLDKTFLSAQVCVGPLKIKQGKARTEKDENDYTNEQDRKSKKQRQVGQLHRSLFLLVSGIKALCGIKDRPCRLVKKTSEVCANVGHIEVTKTQSENCRQSEHKALRNKIKTAPNNSNSQKFEEVLGGVDTSREKDVLGNVVQLFTLLCICWCCLWVRGIYFGHTACKKKFRFSKATKEQKCSSCTDVETDPQNSSIKVVPRTNDQTVYQRVMHKVDEFEEKGRKNRSDLPVNQAQNVAEDNNQINQNPYLIQDTRNSTECPAEIKDETDTLNQPSNSLSVNKTVNRKTCVIVDSTYDKSDAELNDKRCLHQPKDLSGTRTPAFGKGKYELGNRIKLKEGGSAVKNSITNSSRQIHWASFLIPCLFFCFLPITNGATDQTVVHVDLVTTPAVFGHNIMFECIIQNNGHREMKISWLKAIDDQDVNFKLIATGEFISNTFPNKYSVQISNITNTTIYTLTIRNFDMKDIGQSYICEAMGDRFTKKLLLTPDIFIFKPGDGDIRKNITADGEALVVEINIGKVYPHPTCALNIEAVLLESNVTDHDTLKGLKQASYKYRISQCVEDAKLVCTVGNETFSYDVISTKRTDGCEKPKRPTEKTSIEKTVIIIVVVLLIIFTLIVVVAIYLFRKTERAATLKERGAILYSSLRKKVVKVASRTSTDNSSTDNQIVSYRV